MSEKYLHFQFYNPISLLIYKFMIIKSTKAKCLCQTRAQLLDDVPNDSRHVGHFGLVEILLQIIKKVQKH